MISDVVQVEGLVALIKNGRRCGRIVYWNPPKQSAHGHDEHVASHDALLWIRQAARLAGTASLPFPRVPQPRRGYDGYVINGWDVLLPGKGVMGDMSRLKDFPLLGGGELARPEVAAGPVGWPADPNLCATVFVMGGRLMYGPPSDDCFKRDRVMYMRQGPRHASETIDIVVKRTGSVAAIVFVKHHSPEEVVIAGRAPIKRGDVIFENHAQNQGQDPFDHFEHLYDLLADPPSPRARPRFENGCRPRVGGKVTCMGCVIRG